MTSRPNVLIILTIAVIILSDNSFAQDSKTYSELIEEAEAYNKRLPEIEEMEEKAIKNRYQK